MFLNSSTPDSTSSDPQRNPAAAVKRHRPQISTIATYRTSKTIYHHKTSSFISLSDTLQDPHYLKRT